MTRTNPILHLFTSVGSFILGSLDLIFAPLQRLIGTKGMAYFFVLPNLIIFGIFILFPVILNFYYSFTGGTEFLLENRPFVGGRNFETLFNCSNFLNPNSCQEDFFWRSVFNTAKFVVLQVGFMVAFSMITALILNRKIVARGFFRSVFFYPVLLSPVVVALIWRWILQRDGVLNAFIVALGGDKIPFLTNVDWAFFWVVFISVWSNMGFYTLILLAGLQAIPPNLYEASDIDGANSWQAFWNITLPMLMPTMLVVLVLSLIRAVQTFDEVFIFTQGGPGTATTFIVQYIYTTGFADQVRRFGIASSASVLLGITLLIFTLFQLYLGRRQNAT